MSSDAWHLILNGKNANEDTVRDAVAALRERGRTIHVRVTWEQGDAHRYALEAVAAGAVAVIAGGGDGTLHEVCAALAATDRAAGELPALGLMPLGTANDFATAAGLPLDPLAALEVVAATPPRPIDLMRVLPAGGGEHWCVNVATGGFATRITTETSPELKKLFGGAAYFLTGMARMGSIRSARGSLRGPGFEWDGEFLVLAVGNGRQAGGGQLLTPDARLDDGVIDVMVLPPPPPGETTAALGALLSRGRAALLEAAVRTRLPWVEIEAEEGLTFNLDGEPLEAPRLRFEAVRARLCMHLPDVTPLLPDEAPAGRSPG
ncbi:lipid kinase YegS [Coralloluteibacterium stylophorae]|uniref:Probable lipid kinase YegS-like n=1 Tax=Coralloluteibacterium stylophorae TaxID=1776034 RepID=A0A8J7VTJ1_9GAMM|nr:lipid kinase YegS [Coralloluteibacterium stylophorae]